MVAAGARTVATLAGCGSAGGAALACCGAGFEAAVEAGAVLVGAAPDGALDGGAALEVTRSSRLGGCTALVVIIAPPANPIDIATTTVPMPAK